MSSFLIILLGIVLFIFSLINIMNVFISQSSPILKMKFSEGSKRFLIEKSGEYSLCKDLKFFSISPLEEYNPVISNALTGENINLRKVFLRFRYRGFGNSHSEAFSFFAQEGEYIITLNKIYDKNTENNNVVRDRNISNYGLQITKKFNFIKFSLSIWGLVMGLLLFLFGIIRNFI